MHKTIRVGRPVLATVRTLSSRADHTAALSGGKAHAMSPAHSCTIASPTAPNILLSSKRGDAHLGKERLRCRASANSSKFTTFPTKEILQRSRSAEAVAQTAV